MISESKKEYMKEYLKKYYSISENREHKKEYMKGYDNKDEVKNRKKEYDKKPENIERRKKLYHEARIKVLEFIARAHNSEIECWRCHDKRKWVLTIGHIDGSGGIDRGKNRTGKQYFIELLRGNVDLTNIRLECVNCNMCAEWYGKYPDEMTEEGYRLL